MKYNYLVATDMDYTLLLPKTEISEQNKEAISKLRSLGVAFTLATGRASFMVGKYARELDIDVPIITSNGGVLYDPISGKPVYSKNFTASQARKLLNYFLSSSHHIDVTGYASDGIYIMEDSIRRDFFDNYNAGVSPDLTIPLFALNPFLLDSPDQDLPKFNKFLLVGAPEDYLKPLYSDKELEVCSSAPQFCDVMPSGQTKGDALLKLADYLNIPRENTFAFGDSENDLSMLLAAGNGIAMGNSTEDILLAASYVTDTCEQNGFATGIEKFIIPRIVK